MNILNDNGILMITIIVTFMIKAIIVKYKSMITKMLTLLLTCLVNKNNNDRDYKNVDNTHNNKNSNKNKIINNSNFKDIMNMM